MVYQNTCSYSLLRRTGALMKYFTTVASDPVFHPRSSRTEHSRRWLISPVSRSFGWVRHVLPSESPMPAKYSRVMGADWNYEQTDGAEHISESQRGLIAVGVGAVSRDHAEPEEFQKKCHYEIQPQRSLNRNSRREI